MNASKEAAREALKQLTALSETLPPGIGSVERSRHIIAIREFLEAAARKLPSEASFARAKAKPKK